MSVADPLLPFFFQKAELSLQNQKGQGNWAPFKTWFTLTLSSLLLNRGFSPGLYPEGPEGPTHILPLLST